MGHMRTRSLHTPSLSAYSPCGGPGRGYKTDPPLSPVPPEETADHRAKANAGSEHVRKPGNGGVGGVGVGGKGGAGGGAGGRGGLLLLYSLGGKAPQIR